MFVDETIPFRYRRPAKGPISARRLKQLTLFVSIAVLAAVSAAWWLPPLMQGIRTRSLRAACLNYIPPSPNQIVFEEDPTKIDELETQPGYERTTGGRLRWVPQVWRAFAPELQSKGTVFLHRLTSPASHVRLVAVDVAVQRGMWLDTTGVVQDISLMATIIDPARDDQAKAGTVEHRLHYGDCAMWVCPVNPKPTRFFAGRADPADPSHFTFDYERNRTHGTIDGRLNDNDTITLAPRQGTLSHDREPLMWEPE